MKQSKIKLVALGSLTFLLFLCFSTEGCGTKKHETTPWIKIDESKPVKSYGNFLTNFFKNTFTQSDPLKIYTPADDFSPGDYSSDLRILVEYFLLAPGAKKLGVDISYFDPQGEKAEAYFLNPGYHFDYNTPYKGEAYIVDYHNGQEDPNPPHESPEANFWAQIQRIKIPDILKQFSSSAPLKTSYLADSISAADPRATAELRHYIGLKANPRLIPKFCNDITFTGALIKGQKSTINATYTQPGEQPQTVQIVVLMPQVAVPIQPATEISAATMADILKKFTTAKPLKLKALR